MNHRILTAVLASSLVGVGGCDAINPIKEIECKITSASGEIEFQKGNTRNYILNSNTGDYYDEDELSGKLELINGRTSDIISHFDTRALIANNEWRMEIITTDILPLLNALEPSKSLTTLNLETMEITEKNYTFDNYDWKETGLSAGKCKWIKPKTTEILEKPKNE